MRQSWLILLLISVILLGSGQWLVIERGTVLRLPSVRKLCSTIQKPDIIWAMTDKECVQLFAWDRWEQQWEARLVAIGQIVTVLGMIGACFAVRRHRRNENRRGVVDAPNSKIE